MIVTTFPRKEVEMKILSISTALFVCLPLLAGCGPGEDNAVEAQGNDAEPRQSESARTDEAADQRVTEQSARSTDLREGTRLEEDRARAAVAVLHATEGNDVSGTVRFTPADGGLRVNAKVFDLSEGRHAYHVHLYGDCSANDGTSAGTHFNFLGSSTNPPDDIDRITGNLGDLDADAEGRATHVTQVEDASLTGPKSIIGRSVVVHASANDPEQPPIGGAGPRLACGVIGIAEPREGMGE
jgi:Cu-Zn family superoxide dismutase